MIPSKIREGLEVGSSLYIVNGFEGYLSIYDKDGFKKICAYLEKYSDFQEDARIVKRNIYSSTFTLNMDKLGRIQIPTNVLNRYNITHKVVVLGVGDHFEIWDEEVYKTYQEKNDKNFSSLADKLGRDNG